jgi:hypothetical protein
MQQLRDNLFATLSLFTSLGTLVCCALPVLFVTLGAGAVLAGIVAEVPQLIWLSKHKVALFTVAGVLLAIGGTVRYLARNAPCPVDPGQAKACMRLRRTSAVIYLLSLAIFGTGFFFAFVAPALVL